MTTTNPTRPVLIARARLGECPLWDPARQQLAWVDVYNRRIHQFDPSTGDDQFVEAADVVSAVALAGRDRLLIAMNDQLAVLQLQTGAIEPLCRVEFPHPDTRFNDGMCDPQGRFWIGSASEERGQAALYRVDPDGSVHLRETGLTISNGLGWSPDGKTFYLTDSPARKIYAYRFDAERGALSDRRVFVDLDDLEEDIEPDGLTVDQNGDVWSALWNGWAILHFDAQGKLLERIAMPVQRPTSLVFGGPDLSDLYVTSASVGLSQREIQQGFYAGDLFRIGTDSHGMPEHRFALA